jgi:hypothetical protein
LVVVVAGRGLTTGFGFGVETVGVSGATGGGVAVVAMTVVSGGGLVSAGLLLPAKASELSSPAASNATPQSFAIADFLPIIASRP